MIPMSLKKIANITNGLLFGKNIIINNISINTKEIIPNTLFIALKGKQFDAHFFIKEAIKKGCSAIITNRKIISCISYIIVEDTTIALGQIAACLRNIINPKILAITGSCGKTSVKEMTASILKKKHNIIYTINNQNNHIGVPITLLKLKKTDKYAVVELGTNNPGEIDYISKITQPNIALINNIYYSHLEGFKSLLGISKEKSEILSYLKNKGTVIINLDSHHLSQWTKKIKNKKIFYFSIKKKKESDFFATNIKIHANQTCFTMHTPSGTINIVLPYLGYQSISNALAASALSFAVHIPLKQIQVGLLEAPIIPGRLEPIKLSKNTILINDTYNSNVASMIIAIKILEKMPGYKILVIGDMADRKSVV